MESGDIFTRVDSRDDLVRLLKAIVSQSISLSGHSETGVRFTFSPVLCQDITLSGKLSCSSPLTKDDYLSIVFQVSDETFFLRTRFSELSLADAQLVFTDPLFKLQRRQYSRVKATKIEGSRFKLVSLNGRMTGGNLTLVDLSGGGFSIDLDEGGALSLKIGDVVSGRIVIPGRADETVIGEVRHSRIVEAPDGQVVHRYGMQFKDITTKQQERTLQIVFDIYREFAEKEFRRLES